MGADPPNYWLYKTPVRWVSSHLTTFNSSCLIFSECETREVQLLQWILTIHGKQKIQYMSFKIYKTTVIPYLCSNFVSNQYQTAALRCAGRHKCLKLRDREFGMCILYIVAKAEVSFCFCWFLFLFSKTSWYFQQILPLNSAQWLYVEEIPWAQTFYSVLGYEGQPWEKFDCTTAI